MKPEHLTQELQLLYDNAPCGYHSLDAQGNIVRINQTELEMLGYSYQEIIGQNFINFLTPASIKVFQANFPNFKKTGKLKALEFELIAKNGEIIPVNISATAIKNQTGQFVISNSLVIDLREKKHLEKERQKAENEKKELELALSNSETKLQHILDSAIATIASYWAYPDRSWKFTYWSLGAEKLLGYTPEELIKDQNLFASRIPAEDLETVIFAEFANLYTQQTGNMEYRFRHKDNSIRWLCVTYLTHWVEGKNCWVGTNIFTDITARKEAEIALEKQLTREKLITTIAYKIRQTLDLDQILQTTVDEVRQCLKADRVVIFRFNEDFTSGTIITESVTEEYKSILFLKIDDLLVIKQYLKLYHQEQFIIRSNIGQNGNDPIYAQWAQQFQMKANVIIPLFQGKQLWGLLAVHQCSNPRQWEDTEIELLKQLAIQVGIGIQQSQLYQQTRQQLLERQKTQEALSATQQQLQAILKYAPLVIYLLDLDNKYLLVNHHYAELLALTPDDFLGKSIYDFWSKEFADVFALNNRQVIANQQVIEAEESGILADGSLHTYISFKFPLYDPDGKVYAICGMSTDITERQKIQQKIAEQAALIDLASDAITLRDLDHRLLFWSKGAERLYGWQEQEVIGKTIYNFLYENVDVLNDVIKTTLEKGYWQGELTQLTKQGKEIIVASRWTLIKNELEQPQSFLVVNTDITEKKQLEKQFYATQRLESLGTLASGIAHDLNNVLTPILGIVQLLPLRIKNLDQRSTEMLTILQSSARRGADLVKQILTFARGSEGQPVMIEIEHLLKEVAKIASQTLPKSIVIETHIPETGLFVLKVDPTRLHQILMNLVINARDAMPNGGKITISAENQFIDLMYGGMNLKSIIGNYQEGNYVVITVADTGSGITSDIMDHIFEPFFTTKEMGKGTGLGLATVLGIVKNHQGFLQVLSEVDKGSQFKVYLPAMTQNKTPDPIEPTNLKGNGELILIVDDEPFIREINQVALENNNYQTMVASDAIEAIGIYSKYQQDIKIVLIDLIMPSLDGITAIRTLKSINPNINIIAYSGLAEQGQSAILAGAKSFLIKPYTIEQLLEILVNLIQNYDLPSPETYCLMKPIQN